MVNTSPLALANNIILCPDKLVLARSSDTDLLVLWRKYKLL